MKFIKIKSIEILTNGSLNFNKSGFMKYTQVLVYKKDYKNLTFANKTQTISKFETSNNVFKTHYKL